MAIVLSPPLDARVPRLCVEKIQDVGLCFLVHKLRYEQKLVVHERLGDVGDGDGHGLRRPMGRHVEAYTHAFSHTPSRGCQAVKS